jgi:methionine-rich copper-binding protein CopC
MDLEIYLHAGISGGDIRKSNPEPMRTSRTFFLFLSLIIAAAPGAWAHARLIRAEPGKGATVSAPKQIDLWFNELLEDGFNTVTVFPEAELSSGEKHSNLTNGKPMVDGKDRTHLSVKLNPLAPGEYVVEWRVLSRDGHSAPGRSTFHVTAK